MAPTWKTPRPGVVGREIDGVRLDLVSELLKTILPLLDQSEKDHAKQREARKDVVTALAGCGDILSRIFRSKEARRASARVCHFLTQ